MSVHKNTNDNIPVSSYGHLDSCHSDTDVEDVKPLPKLFGEPQLRYLDEEQTDGSDVTGHGDVHARRVLRTLRAASLGDVDTLRQLGEAEVTAARDPLGRDALFYAAFHGQAAAVTCLLHELHVPPNHRDADGRGVLQYACAGGELKVMDVLLRGTCELDTETHERKASIASQPEQDVTDLLEGLVLAARQGHVQLVAWLLGGAWGQVLLERLRDGTGASLLHLMGHRLRAEDLVHLRDCGLSVDVTTTSRRGVLALQQLRPQALAEFLDTAVTCTAPEHHRITEAFLVSNPFVHEASPDLDLRTLIALSESPAHQHLVLHPVFAGVCAVKWRFVRKWYYAVLATFLLFATVTSSIAVFSVQNAYFHENQETINTQFRHYKSQSFGWQIALCSVLAILLACEILSKLLTNMYVNILRYLVWITSIILVLIVLTSPVAILQENSFFIFLVPWSLCTKHLGHHYKLAQYYSNFIEISKTFLRILCLFGSIIIAFVLTLHVAMLNDQESPFRYLHSSALKTITMMVGDMTIEEFHTKFTNFQWSITFLLFAIVLTVLLYNMTNALAVSDTNRLERQADLYRATSLARQILWCQTLLRNVVPTVADFAVQCCHFQWIIAGFTPVSFSATRAVTAEEEHHPTRQLSLRVSLELIDKLRAIVGGL